MADELRGEGAEDVVWIAVGKKGAGTLRFRGRMPIDRVFQGFTTDRLRQRRGIEHRRSGALHRRRARPRGGGLQRVQVGPRADGHPGAAAPRARQVVEDDDDDPDAHPTFTKALAFFEPDAKEFLTTLLPTYLDTTIYRALLESAAAELGARRTAMRNASDNATTLIGEYTLAMNRARQAAITQEILEVVAGADALE